MVHENPRSTRVHPGSMVHENPRLTQVRPLGMVRENPGVAKVAFQRHSLAPKKKPPGNIPLKTPGTFTVQVLQNFLTPGNYNIPFRCQGSEGSEEPEQRTFEKFSLKTRKFPGNSRKILVHPWHRKGIYIVPGVPKISRFYFWANLRDGAARLLHWTCPVPLTVRGTQALVGFPPLAPSVFCAARQDAVLRRSLLHHT